MSYRMEGVTVVIPLTDALEERMLALDTCLESLMNQTAHQGLIDIVVTLVSCGVPEGDLHRLVLRCHHYHAALVPWNTSISGYQPSFTRNIGGRWGRRKLLTFVDADAVIHPEALQASMEAFEDSPDGKIYTTIKTSMTPWEAGAKEYDVSDPEGFTALANFGGVAFGTGCCTVTTQEAWENLGGFDERFVGYGPTDIDFTGRLYALGYERVDLTEEQGLVNLHQHHERGERDGDPGMVESRTRNRSIMEQALERGELVRNLNEFGGVPWEQKK